MDWGERGGRPWPGWEIKNYFSCYSPLLPSETNCLPPPPNLLRLGPSDTVTCHCWWMLVKCNWLTSSQTLCLKDGVSLLQYKSVKMLFIVVIWVTFVKSHRPYEHISKGYGGEKLFRLNSSCSPAEHQPLLCCLDEQRMVNNHEISGSHDRPLSGM
jgi:hypothetical protein